MPDNEVFIHRGLRDDAGHLSGADVDAVPLLFGCILQAHRGIMAELHLAVGFKFSGPVKAVQLVIPDVQRRQGVTIIRESEVGRLLKEKPPAGAPNPELPLATRIKGQVVRFGAVPLEKRVKLWPVSIISRNPA